MPSITPCLWFNMNAEEAATFYCTIFPNSSILGREQAGSDTPSQPAGDTVVVEFQLDGTRFLGLNGGPQFPFSEAVSFTIDCADQEEVDYYWDRLLDGGEPSQCGWLTDRFGLSWQVVPRRLNELTSHPDPEVARRATEAMLGMIKIDVAALEQAAFNSAG